MGGFTVSLSCVARYLLLQVLFLPHLLGFDLFPELTEKNQGLFLMVVRDDMTKDILGLLFRPNQFFESIAGVARHLPLGIYPLQSMSDDHDYPPTHAFLHVKHFIPSNSN